MKFHRSIITTAALFAGLVSVVQSAILNPQYVDTMVQPYLAIHQELAKDNLQNAKSSASDYLNELNLASPKINNTDILDFNIAAERILEAETIEEARSGFLIASIAMENLVSSVGTTSNPRLYVFNCPMAFDNKGGQWIQADQSVKNPYFGLMNSGCGIVKNQISGKLEIIGNGNELHEITSLSRGSMLSNTLMPASQEIINSQGEDYPGVCVVSDEPLVDGEIEQFAYKGKLVRFCCKGCKKDFMQDPEHYLHKLDKLQGSSPDKVGDRHNGHDHSGHAH